MKRLHIVADKDVSPAIVLTDRDTGEKVEDVMRIEFTLVPLGWMRALVTFINRDAHGHRLYDDGKLSTREEEWSITFDLTVGGEKAVQ